ncbi:MAG TPA: V-type ATPase subunit [Bacillota bacterium]|nr:V-type ATPase subunit [Bacillota bacterium]
MHPATDTDYAHLSGRIRAMEARMLGPAVLERLADAPSLPAACRLLAETDYRQVSEAEEPAGVVEAVLLGVYQEVRSLSPHPAPVDVVALGRWLGAEATRIRQGDPGGQPGSPHELDEQLHQERFRRMGRAAGAIGTAFFEDLVGLWGDVANFEAMARAKLLGQAGQSLDRRLVPGKREPELFLRAAGEPWEQLPRLFAGTPLERGAARAAEEAAREGAMPTLGKAMDDALIAFARSARRLAMGPEVVTGFLLGREIEARNLRLIFLGVARGMGGQAIRRRLREAYV